MAQAAEHDAQTPGTGLRSARRAKGLTQVALARAVGASPQSIVRWENDISSPKMKFWRPLADALGLELSPLLELLQLSPSEAANNVISLPSTSVGISNAGKAPSAEQAALLDHQRRFLDAMLSGLESGEAAKRWWVTSARATAKMLALPWDDEVSLSKEESGDSE